MKFSLSLLGLIFAVCVFANAPTTPATNISFQGKAALRMIEDGKTTTTIRLSDRTQPPTSYKVGMVLELVNSDQAEEKRTPDQQMAEDAYKFVEITKLEVKKVDQLTAAEQADVKRFYSAEKIAQAQGVVTVVGLKYKATR